MKSTVQLSPKSLNRRIIVILFSIMFVAYIFTAEGYMSSDPKGAFSVSIAIIKQEAIPNFKEGETAAGPDASYFPICKSGILCSRWSVGYSLLFVPFIVVQDTFHILPDDLRWHYNPPEMVFTSLFFGPIIAALSVTTVFLILRELDYQMKTSLLVSFIFGFASMLWPYSQTSYNILPSVLLTLLGIWFLIKFQKTNSSKQIFLSGIFLISATHIRVDALLFVLLILGFLTISFVYKKTSVKKIFVFLIPVVFGIILHGIINLVRFESITEFGYGSYGRGDLFLGSFSEGLFGLLFSSGYGLILYCPIAITAVLAYKDFFTKNRAYFFLFLAFFISFLLFYSTKDFWSAGPASWGPRFLLSVIPFLVIPLAASIEIRNKIKFKLFLIFSIILAVTVNVIKIPINLVPIWDCRFGGFGCLKLKPGAAPSLVTFNPDYSNFASAMKLFPQSFTDFQSSMIFSPNQPDILILNLLGIIPTIILSVATLSFLIFLLLKSLRKFNDQKIVQN